MPEVLIDDLHLLRAIDAMETAEWTDGLNVMNAAGLQQDNEAVRKAFVRLVGVLAEDGQLRVDHVSPRLGNAPSPRPDEWGYLSTLRNFRLTSAGVDRARGRVVLAAGLDPATDDGRRFPGRVIERAASVIADRFTPEELPTFLVDAGIPPERMPQATEDKAEYVTAVLKGLAGREAPGRRVVRRFLGRWLDDELEVAPTAELRSDLLADLARAGWHLSNGDLVTGDPIKTDRMQQEPLPNLALAVARVTKIGRQLPVVIRQLQRRQRGRPPYEVRDEYDLQDLLHALLRIDHTDVRPEEWTPSYAGSSARMDFLLKRERVVVEAKKTRSGLGEREIGKQLIVDAAQYAEHPSVDALVCIVLDLDREVGNPHGFEDDLAALGSKTLNVVAVVAQ